MAKYVYPAIFTEEKEGGYSVNFPDLESCYTCGDDLQDAIRMAEDVLAFTLYDLEKKGTMIPASSKITDVKVGFDEFVNYVACDTIGYQKRSNNKAVKKTLSIPEWLNEEAMRHSINFSQVLQEALIEKLHV